MTRINRATFWLGILILFAVMLIVSTVSRNMPTLLTGGAVALALLGRPRLHDFGLTGWVLLVPVAAIVAILVAARGFGPAWEGVTAVDVVMLATVALLGAIPGHGGINRFGRPQKPLARR
jgi:uncharacterized membrane protein YhaH (DUF805 family)